MKELPGDCLQAPQRPLIIAHICNDMRKWGAGFTNAIDQKWPTIGQIFKITKQNLGHTQYITAEPGIIIANMIAQKGVKTKSNKTPIDYGALQITLLDVAATALKTNSTVVMPMIGTGLAGGKWEIIKAIIQDSIPQAIIYTN